MTNVQGTVWESRIRDDARARNLVSDRYPKRSQKHEPDLYIEMYKDPFDLPYGVGQLEHMFPAVFWKRLVGKKGPSPRKPDGERAVVVIGYNDFLDLLEILYERGVSIRVEGQAKWTSALNVTRTLGGLRDWLKAHVSGYNGGSSWPSP